MPCLLMCIKGMHTQCCFSWGGPCLMGNTTVLSVGIGRTVWNWVGVTIYCRIHTKSAFLLFLFCPQFASRCLTLIGMEFCQKKNCSTWLMSCYLFVMKTSLQRNWQVILMGKLVSGVMNSALFVKLIDHNFDLASSHILTLHLHTFWPCIFTHFDLASSHILILHLHTFWPCIFTHFDVASSHIMTLCLHTLWPCIFTHFDLASSHILTSHLHKFWPFIFTHFDVASSHIMTLSRHTLWPCIFTHFDLASSHIMTLCLHTLWPCIFTHYDLASSHILTLHLHTF